MVSALSSRKIEGKIFGDWHRNCCSLPKWQSGCRACHYGSLLLLCAALHGFSAIVPATRVPATGKLAVGGQVVIFPSIVPVVSVSLLILTVNGGKVSNVDQLEHHTGVLALDILTGGRFLIVSGRNPLNHLAIGNHIPHFTHSSHCNRPFQLGVVNRFVSVMPSFYSIVSALSSGKILGQDVS
jgi:hypothetical protein